MYQHYNNTAVSSVYILTFTRELYIFICSHAVVRHPFISTQSTSFSISYRESPVVRKSFSFCLSRKALFSPSHLNNSFAIWYNILGVFSFNALKISSHSLLTTKVSAEKSADHLTAAPFYKSLFSLSLSLIICLNVTLFCFILFGIC